MGIESESVNERRNADTESDLSTNRDIKLHKDLWNVVVSKRQNGLGELGLGLTGTHFNYGDYCSKSTYNEYPCVKVNKEWTTRVGCDDRAGNTGCWHQCGHSRYAWCVTKGSSGCKKKYREDKGDTRSENQFCKETLERMVRKNGGFLKCKYHNSCSIGGILEGLAQG